MAADLSATTMLHIIDNLLPASALQDLRDLCDIHGQLKEEHDGDAQFEVSNNVPSNLTKGSGTGLSALIYGNFSDLLIGMFGQLEILVDPYTDFAKGTVGVRALQSIDIAVRHAESFAAMQDAIA